MPVLFVSNTETGAWGRYTGWDVLCMEVFGGRLYFGSADGRVYIANTTGLDDGVPYTGVVMPLFEDFGSPASLKVPKVGRAVVRATTALSDNVNWHGDFDTNLPASPNATQISEAASIWDAGVWGESVWGGSSPQVISDNWRSLGGRGYVGSVSYQVTSGAAQPLDAELIRMEVLFDTAEMVT